MLPSLMKIWFFHITAHHLTNGARLIRIGEFQLASRPSGQGYPLTDYQPAIKVREGRHGLDGHLFSFLIDYHCHGESYGA